MCEQSQSPNAAIKLTAANAVEYLRSHGYLASHESACASELAGGVSNAVIHVTREDGDDLVLKQSRAQLSVADPWFCSIDRIWREVDVLRTCHKLFDTTSSSEPFEIEVPRLLFDDRENYLYAMTAAPSGHVVWKTELLFGVTRIEVARSCGILLGTLHAGTWHDPFVAHQLDDRQYFNDLRLDPYYREIARVHPDLSLAIERLIDSLLTERHCLVHGDFSPKNLLVHGNRLTLIDFEVGHYGDPAFDLGFFLSHLMLKAFCFVPNESPFFELMESFWNGYQAEMAKTVSVGEIEALVKRGIQNFGGCALARLDGKSKVDYLTDPVRREQMRELCRKVFAEQPNTWIDVRLLASKLLSTSLSPNYLATN